MRLHMMGHYAEPPLDLILNATDSPHALFHMTYNPMTGEWKQRKLTDQPDMEEDGEGEKEKEREHSGKGKEKEKEKEDDEGMMVIEVLSLSLISFTY